MKNKQNEVVESNVVYGILELANNGEFFEIIFETKQFDENMIRFYLS